MVIGGMANAVWGNPRATVDVDVTIWSPNEINKTVEILLKPFEALVSKPVNFIHETRVLPLQTKDKVRLDIIFGSLPYEQEAINRAIGIEISGIKVQFCTPEDLILHKIISEREKDLDDIRGILKKRLQSLDLSYLEPRIRELVDAIEDPGRWESWLKWKNDATTPTKETR